MGEHLKAVKVVALVDTSITKPTPQTLRVGQIVELPRWCAEIYIEAGDVRMHEGGSENKALPGPAINKNALALAKKFAVDPAEIEGSGKGGRVVKKDVEKYIDDLGLEEPE